MVPLLLGAAADTVFSFLSSLQPTGASGASGDASGGQSSPAFAPAAAATSGASPTPAPITRAAAPALHSNEIMAALIAAQEQQQPQALQPDGSLSAREARLFGRIDADGNGKIEKSEFQKLFGNLDPSIADAAFAKLDQNGDGAISQGEFAAARPGHHHHVASPGGASGSDQASGSSRPTTTTTTNSDGSTTTTVTYADGSKFTMTTPATASVSVPGASGGKGENLLQQLFNLQAQLSSASANAPTTAL